MVKIVEKIGISTLAICITILFCFSIFGGIIIHLLDQIYFAMPDGNVADYSDDLSNIMSSLSSIDSTVSSTPSNKFLCIQEL